MLEIAFQYHLMNDVMEWDTMGSWHLERAHIPIDVNKHVELTVSANEYFRKERALAQCNQYHQCLINEGA